MDMTIEEEFGDELITCSRIDMSKFRGSGSDLVEYYSELSKDIIHERMILEIQREEVRKKKNSHLAERLGFWS